MARRKRTPLARYDTETYPTLDEHRSSRRDFLKGSLAVMGAGALAAACDPFQPGMQGVMPRPDYHQCRFPEKDDRSVWLSDGGYARFFAVATTYQSDCVAFAEDANEDLTDRLAASLCDASSEALATQAGVSDAAETMRQVLNQAYRENTGDIGDHWFEYVDLVITRIDPPEIAPGMGGSEPEYP